jgi:hypothetical protein
VDTKAIAVAPGGDITKLEKDDPSVDIAMYRQGLHVYVAKGKLDAYIEETKQAKKLRFQLNHFSVERTEEGTFYVFSREYYRQLGTLFKLPPLESIKVL